MSPARRIAFAMAAVLSAPALVGLSPAGAAAQQGGSLDDELLKDLGSGPLGPPETAGPNDGQGEARPDAVIERPEDLQKRLQQELGAAAQSEDDNPLLAVARPMQEVQGRLVQKDSGPGTQVLQKQILADLDRLIEQAKKSCSGSKPGGGQPQQVASRTPIGQPSSKPGGGGAKPGNQPATRPSDQTRAGAGDARPPTAEEVRRAVDKRVWGELPEKAREQMLEAWGEEFLPQYRELIEDYFRRLSEQRSGASGP